MADPPTTLRDFLLRMIHNHDQRGMACADYALHLWQYYDALTSAGFSPEFSESMVMSLDTRIGWYAQQQENPDY